MQSRPHVRTYFLLIVVVLSLMALLVPDVSAKPNMDEVANMADAIRYLEKLDKYYSQVARPRFGKRSLVDGVIRDPVMVRITKDSEYET